MRSPSKRSRNCRMTAAPCGGKERSSEGGLFQAPPAALRILSLTRTAPRLSRSPWGRSWPGLRRTGWDFPNRNPRCSSNAAARLVALPGAPVMRIVAGPPVKIASKRGRIPAQAGCAGSRLRRTETKYLVDQTKRNFNLCYSALPPPSP